jgi:hypothetical protein
MVQSKVPYPSNIFIDDITDEGNKHAPAIGKMLPCLLFAHNIVLGRFYNQWQKREMHSNGIL